MKNLFLVFGLFLTFIPPAISAEPSVECPNEGVINDFVNRFFDSACLEMEDKARCACLAKEKPGNPIMNTINPKIKIIEYQDNLRAKRTKNFWNVYSEMIHGSAFQKEILFDNEQGSEQPKVVGCTASEMAEEIDKKIEHHLDVKKDLEEDELKNAISRLKKCTSKNNCQDEEAEVTRREENFKKKNKDERQEICNRIKIDNKKTSAQIHLETAQSWYRSINLPSEITKVKINKIECLLIKIDVVGTIPEDYRIKGCEVLTGPWRDSSFSQSAQYIVKSTPNGSGIGEAVGAAVPTRDKNIFGDIKPSTQSCGIDSHDIQVFMEEFDQEKINYLKAEGSTLQANEVGSAASLDAGGLHLSECGESEICKGFDEINKKALLKREQNFGYSANNCISYPEFLMKKGIPGDAFMQALAETPDDKVGDLLKMPKFLGTVAEKQRQDFLKSNPLVAKLSLTDAKRVKLAQELKKVALTNQNKSKAKKLESYLTFMQKPVKELLKEDDFMSAQKFLCDQMINNYTAIQISNELPPTGDDKDELPLVSALRNCEISLNKITSVTEAVGSLEFNDLFKEAEGDAPELSDDEKFKKMNDENCKEYPAFAHKMCSDVKDETCRKKFLASTDMKDEQDVFDKQGTARQLTKANFNRAASYSRDKDQNTVFKGWWNRKVGSKLSKNVIPYKGQTGEFAQAQAEDKAKVAAAAIENKLPKSLKNQDFSSKSVANSDRSLTNQKISDTSVQNNLSDQNPGQVVPNFQENPVKFDPANLIPGQSVTKAIENFDNLPQEDQITGLTKVKDYLSGNKSTLDEVDYEEKIAETEEKLANELQKQKALKEKFSSFDFTAPQFNSNVNQLNPSAGTSKQTTSPMNNSNFGSANMNKNSTNGQNAGNFNDALNSVNNTKSANMIVRPGVVSEKEFKGKLEISQELIASSEKEFQKLSTDASALELYLKTFLTAEDIGEGRIISIKGPAVDGRPQNLIFRVIMEDGRYIVQSLPKSVKVERVSTLRGLNLDLKSKQ